MWQTLGKQTKKPSLGFCFPHPSLPKFSSLWLGNCRFPNKLAETCCLWVRPSSPPAGQQSCHPQCKQVALASQGEWAERVGVTQATPIQNSQLTSNTKATATLASPWWTLVWVFSVCLFVSFPCYALALLSAFTFSVQKELKTHFQLFYSTFFCLCVFPCFFCEDVVLPSGTSSRPQASRFRLDVNEQNRSGCIWWGWPCCQMIFMCCLCFCASDNRCRPDLYAPPKYSLCCANTGDLYLRYTNTYSPLLLLFSPVLKQRTN